MPEGTQMLIHFEQVGCSIITERRRRKGNKIAREIKQIG